MMFSVRINRIIGINSLVPTGERGQRASQRETCVQCIYFGGCGRRAIKHGHSKSAPDMGCIIIGLHSPRALRAQPERDARPADPTDRPHDMVFCLCCVGVSQAAAANSHYAENEWPWCARGTLCGQRECGCDVISGIAGINLIFQVLKTAIMERSGSRINHSARQTQSRAERPSLDRFWFCDVCWWCRRGVLCVLYFQCMFILVRDLFMCAAYWFDNVIFDYMCSLLSPSIKERDAAWRRRLLLSVLWFIAAY